MRTQAALYGSADPDLELSWSEAELPQTERTKHVHGLHPYLGKFIPQLVETFLYRYFRPGDCILDPFAGSGTTLVEANAFGAHSLGCDISAFNCLLARVKMTAYSPARVELALKTALEAARLAGPASPEEASEWLRHWYAPQALGELLAYRTAIEELDDPAWDAARIVLSRAARSARLTTHFDLDFPPAPVREPYHCYKHRRTCRPVEEAAKLLRRYTADTGARLRKFAPLRTGCQALVLHDDARTVEFPLEPTGVITSPPYPGVIDYHEQHRYAFELLGLAERGANEIGAVANGKGRAAEEAYVRDMVAALGNAGRQLAPGAPVIVVVSDGRGLYRERIVPRAGLEVEETVTRHVNRRTGRRAGEFYEQILVCRSA